MAGVISNHVGTGAVCACFRLTAIIRAREQMSKNFPHSSIYFDQHDGCWLYAAGHAYAAADIRGFGDAAIDGATAGNADGNTFRGYCRTYGHCNTYPDGNTPPLH
jgi:hypothetical protein